ncbi:MAG: DNA replication protein, partial [Bradyrhizobiaceae bacterium]
AWLARRKGRDGHAMIGHNQFIAGEKLRADFTRGHLAPRVTSSWSGIARGKNCGGGDAGTMTDVVIAARQRVRLALDACGPELSGILLDVCCFLRGLEDVERERGWPARSAKVVLQLALDRLARHYGLRDNARDSAHIRTWLAEDASFTA